MGLPVEVNNLMLGSLGGYTVGRSLRFRSSASANLTRTPSSAGNRKTWTWSGWVKRGTFGTDQWFLRANSTGSDFFLLGFSAANQFYSSFTAGVSAAGENYTTAVFRDPSAWYHCVCAFDSTQATASNRVKLYVNGVQQTLGVSNAPTLNADYQVNSTNLHYIGGFSGNYADFYLAEVNLIDGQQLTPSSFGAYDTNGVWQPKKYSGTYGTNGFYLPFSNTTSTTTLVQDSSGNGNNWTPNNISLTAGTTYDSMIDSPTNAAGNSNGIGNYAVLNPLRAGASFINNGNLSITNINNGSTTFYGSMYSTNWYAELTVDSLTGGGVTYIGVALENNTDYSYVSDGTKQSTSGGNQAYSGTGYTTGDVIGIAYSSSGTITFYKNNVSQGAAFTGLSGNGTFMLASGSSTARTYSVNFGQRPFTYTPPTGFKALNTYNLPAPSIANGAQYMAATTYTGNGGTQSVTNGGNNTLGITFQPDLVWVKNRSYGAGNVLSDSVRGSSGGKYYILESDATSPESDFTSTWYGNYGYLSAINSNGFTAVNGSLRGNYNTNSDAYVAWQWKGGGTGVTNTSGTITSTVSASPSSGFSIATYTGNGTAGATVGHGLGVTPAMVIMKSRTLTGSAPTSQWLVWHQSISQALHSSSTIQLNGFTGALYLNLTNASSAYGMDAQINGSGQTYVAYCFSAVRGYSAFGSYTGNGSTDGPFVFTNFRPRWLMVKAATTAATWVMFDTARSVGNVTGLYLCPNLSQAEAGPGVIDIDVLSNGFKLRNNDGAMNTANTYIYAAFAENPFNYSRAR